MAALATAALLAALLLIPAAGRADDRPPPSGERFTLVEHVQVAGSCVEDHVGEPTSYAGFIDQWRDGKKKTRTCCTARSRTSIVPTWPRSTIPPRPFSSARSARISWRETGWS